MKQGNSKSKAKKETRKKPAAKQPPATGETGSQGTAGTIRRWVETLERLSRSHTHLGVAVVLSHS